MSPVVAEAVREPEPAVIKGRLLSVNVPADAAAQTGTPPVTVKTLVDEPIANLASVLAPEAYKMSPVA